VTLRARRHGELVDAIATLQDLGNDLNGSLILKPSDCLRIATAVATSKLNEADNVFANGTRVGVEKALSLAEACTSLQQLVEAVDNSGLKIDVCVSCGNWMMVPEVDDKDWMCQVCSNDPVPPGYAGSEDGSRLSTEVGHGS
jgi:hypothetical protein